MWVLIVSVVAAGTLACATVDRPRPVEAGFWLERLTYDLIGLGGPLTPRELALVETAALDEIRRAFAGVAVRVSPRRDARYIVTVVPHLYDLRVRRTSEVFGNARAMRGFGGRGAVNFYAVASAGPARAVLRRAALGLCETDADARVRHHSLITNR